MRYDFHSAAAAHFFYCTRRRMYCPSKQAGSNLSLGAQNQKGACHTHSARFSNQGPRQSRELSCLRCTESDCCDFATCHIHVTATDSPLHLPSSWYVHALAACPRKGNTKGKKKKVSMNSFLYTDCCKHTGVGREEMKVAQHLKCVAQQDLMNA